MAKEPELDVLFGKPVQVLPSQQGQDDAPSASAPRVRGAGGNGTGALTREPASEELSRLNARLENRTRQLTALYEIGRTLAATLDLQKIYWAMFREIAQGLLGTPHLIVALFDPESEMIRCGFAIVDGQEMDASQFPPMPLGDGPVSQTIRSRTPRIVDLREMFPQRQANGRAVLKGSGQVPQSALYVPMVSGDRVIGVMHIQHYEAQAFRESDLPLLSTLGSQAAVALTNAQLYAREQERANALALALEKQKELDGLRTEILQNVSHELRTPLSIAYGYIELLDGGALGELNPEHKAPVHIIAQRVEALVKMVEDFTVVLDSGTTNVPRTPVHLGFLVQMLRKDYRDAAQRAGLCLVVETAPDLPPVSGHASQLRQVLDHLINNALKFTPSGGTVAVGLWHRDGEVVLQVRDDGIGIPHDEQSRIFERFYQVDGSATRRYGGMGLGLALVKEVVEAHGGRVSVESSLGQGSTFQVVLPAGA